ncbi:MAG: DNA-protecting protein DprA [Pseudomonadales bacterium]|nr:DNA-protecting protein DprA [Pseudomonadales bacterium]
MHQFKSELHAVLALNRITLGFPNHAMRLLHGLDSVRSFFMAYRDTSNRENPFKLPPRIASLLARPGSQDILKGVDRDLSWLEGENHHLVSIFDPLYPFLLQQVDDPPICLFCMGHLPLLKMDQIAIVGSRKPTQLGLKISGSIAGQLARQGIVITSGMAHGIDAAAHGGALESSGTTIAVFGSGLDKIYPRNHERLALRILKMGLIISEFPIGTPPLARHFPQRNRIVTGLSLGTLVVEATLKSGSMISARMAMEQNREVFAIPGSIYSPQSEGCHELIKLGAKLIQSADDVLEELPGYGRVTGIKAVNNLSEESLGILCHLNATPISVDELFELTAIPLPSLLSQLLSLEMEGHILQETLGYVKASRAAP